MSHDSGERGAQRGERCTCGRQAVVVYLTERFGEVGWCGRSDGGRRGPCVFCDEPAGHLEWEQRCRLYTVHPDTVHPDTLRPDPEHGPEAA